MDPASKRLKRARTKENNFDDGLKSILELTSGYLSLNIIEDLSDYLKQY